MNDVELIAQALLKNNSGTSESENVKVLFRGNAKYNEKITLSESITNFNMLIFTFQINYIKQSVMIDVGEDCTVVMTEIPTGTTQNWVNYVYGSATKTSNTVYKISYIKRITNEGVIILNKDEQDFSCISVIGLK